MYTTNVEEKREVAVLKLNRTLRIILCALCTVGFVTATLLLMPQAEDKWVVPLMLGMLAPTLPVTALTELICILTRREQQVGEKIVFWLDVGATLFLSGFWLLMVMQGGEKNLSWAIPLTLANTITTALLRIKIFLVKRCSQSNQP